MEADQIENFWYWVNEREHIRILREGGHPPPWTDDGILQQFRFCNVRREDDAVTVWVREHIREPYAENDNLWFMLAIARHLNLPSTIQAVMDAQLWPVNGGYQPRRIAALLNKFPHVFNAAYIINGAGAKPGYSKVDHVFRTVLDGMWKDREKIQDHLMDIPSMESATTLLSTYKGIGGFMAYQIAVDMSWTHYLRNAKDLNTWAMVGPGSKRGINRLRGMRLGEALSPKKALPYMRELYDMQEAYAEDYVGHIRLSDIQNCLCEFDKYMRAYEGTGVPKRKVHYA